MNVKVFFVFRIVCTRLKIDCTQPNNDASQKVFNHWRQMIEPQLRMQYECLINVFSISLNNVMINTGYGKTRAITFVEIIFTFFISVYAIFFPSFRSYFHVVFKRFNFVFYKTIHKQFSVGSIRCCGLKFQLSNRRTMRAKRP